MHVAPDPLISQKSFTTCRTIALPALLLPPKQALERFHRRFRRSALMFTHWKSGPGPD